MFENVLGQPAAAQLSRDIEEGLLAPSMLFCGPPASGKGTAGLELGRILSCENTGPRAPWNCTCSACSHHRSLSHPDILLLGSRSFSAEIAAGSAAFLREPGAPSVRLLFLRSLRKLLARFSPVLWEDDAKFGKIRGPLTALEEDADDLSALAGETRPLPSPDILKKLCDRILKNAFKLEAEGMGEGIPISQIRRAAFWSRLAPQGKHKLLLIENADRMSEGGRNSLLKILEEPPATVTIVLTSSREEALLPTILSRLRPYHFAARPLALEAEVVRRVFRDPAYADALGAGGGEKNRDAGLGKEVKTYLDSFLPMPGNVLPLAAFFAASAAYAAALDLRRRGGSSLPPPLIALGKYTAPIAEAAGLGRPLEDLRAVLAKVLGGLENFEARGLFSQFLSRLLALISESFRSLLTSPGEVSAPHAYWIPYNDIWRNAVKEADIAVNTYNQNPVLALERMAAELRRALGEGI
ncbi:MAG: DNA polymerase III [Treponema sp.]|jgi:DNA polymerase-3 subunit gamma/tau|nr:DNA polymerase III [Treponema sp.]